MQKLFDHNKTILHSSDTYSIHFKNKVQLVEIETTNFNIDSYLDI